MRSREEVLREFGTATCVKGDDCIDFDCVAIRGMADRIRELESPPRPEPVACLLCNGTGIQKRSALANPKGMTLVNCSCVNRTSTVNVARPEPVAWWSQLPDNAGTAATTSDSAVALWRKAGRPVRPLVFGDVPEPNFGTPHPPVRGEAVAWEAKYQKARQVIADLCEGRRSWIMSIPARPHVDPDLVISDALEAMRQALTHPSAAAEADVVPPTVAVEAQRNAEAHRNNVAAVKWIAQQFCDEYGNPNADMPQWAHDITDILLLGTMPKPSTAPVPPVSAMPLSDVAHIRWWLNAYTDPASGPHFRGHGVMVKLVREYLSLREAPVVPVVTECQWREDEDGNWETSCGEMWRFIDDGPERNGVKFCHSCGKPCAPKAFDDAASEVRG